jgi:hypothetical protein
MLVFDSIVSSDVVNNKLVLQMVGTDKKRYGFALTPRAAALVATALQGASKYLTGYSGPAIEPIAFQPRTGDEPAILVELDGNLTIALSLPPRKLASLKASIARLEQKP